MQGRDLPIAFRAQAAHCAVLRLATAGLLRPSLPSRPSPGERCPPPPAGRHALSARRLAALCHGRAGGAGQAEVRGNGGPAQAPRRPESACAPATLLLAAILFCLAHPPAPPPTHTHTTQTHVPTIVSLVAPARTACPPWWQSTSRRPPLAMRSTMPVSILFFWGGGWIWA